ncbi:MAG: 30S ribosomal protein S6 [Patescibacteria group bacterium]
MVNAEAENKEINEETEQSSEIFRIYEIGFHLIPSLSEDEIAEEVGNIKKIIEDAGGVYITEDYPKTTTLEYTIEVPITMPKSRFSHSQFGWIKFEANAEAPGILEEALSRNTNIIRMIIIKTVRENTLYGYKLKQKKEDEEKSDKESQTSSVEQKEEGERVSDEEIDKSIEEIVV